MFDLDVGKMVVFAIVALAVIPPKDLPRVLRTVGKYVGQMRRMASDFQGQFMDALKEADVESVKKEFEALGASAKIDSSFDPVMAMRSEMTKAVEGPASPAPSAPVAEPAVAEPALPDEPFRREVVVTPLAVASGPETVVAAEVAEQASTSSGAAPSAASMTDADIEATKAPLMDHIIELRQRLIRALYAFFAAFLVCFYFSRSIYNILT